MKYRFKKNQDHLTKCQKPDPDLDFWEEDNQYWEYWCVDYDPENNICFTYQPSVAYRDVKKGEYVYFEI